MASIKGTQTEKNLLTAFAGESQANRKYLAFAKKADQDGFPQVAKLFRAAAAAGVGPRRQRCFSGGRPGPGETLRRGGLPNRGRCRRTWAGYVAGLLLSRPWGRGEVGGQEQPRPDARWEQHQQHRGEHAETGIDAVNWCIVVGHFVVQILAAFLNVDFGFFRQSQ